MKWNLDLKYKAGDYVLVRVTRRFIIDDVSDDVSKDGDTATKGIIVTKILKKDNSLIYEYSITSPEIDNDFFFLRIRKSEIVRKLTLGEIFAYEMEN